MIYDLKTILRAITIIIGIALYVLVWVSMILNWDRCMRTGYAYPCLEDLLGKFYSLWVMIHVLGVIFIFMWAWVD